LLSSTEVSAKFGCSLHCDGTGSLFMGKLEEISFSFDHKVTVYNKGEEGVGCLQIYQIYRWHM